MNPVLEQRAFYLMLGLVSLAFLWVLKPFFAAIFWAFAMTVVFQPLQQRLLDRWPQRRNMAAFITLLCGIVLVVAPVLLVISSFIAEGVGLYQAIQAGEIKPEQYLERVRQGLPLLQTMLERFNIDFSSVKENVVAGLSAAGQLLARQAINIGQNTFQFFLQLLLMLYLTFFLLRDGPRILGLVRSAIPLGEERAALLLAKFSEVTRATIKGNILIAMIQGAIGGIVFWLLGIPAAVLWGVIMAVLSLIPAVGASLIWVPVAIYLYATGAWIIATILVFVGVFIIGLIDNLLRPILVGRDTKLPDYLVLFSTLGGLAAFGITGFALGPLLAALFMAFWGIFIRDFNVQPSVNAPPEPTVPDANKSDM